MQCEHCETADLNRAASTSVCEKCVETGDTWVHLRVCKTCGHVGCCDSSKNQHARRHYEETGHAVMGPTAGGGWLWCYEHDSYVEPDGTLR
jgi:uncharacterized UBP type Zn finger protein